METHEFPDLVVRFPLGVEITSTLSTTHHQTSQGVLEDLLETQAARGTGSKGKSLALLNGLRGKIVQRCKRGGKSCSFGGNVVLACFAQAKVVAKAFALK